MISTGVLKAARLVVCGTLAMIGVASASATAAESQIVNRELRSGNFAQNKIGTGPVRKMIVYLPAGYEASVKRYPVIYFLATPFDSDRAAFDKKNAQDLFDRAIASGVIDKFILVSVDMTTPLGSSWYVNSPVTGNWEDFMTQELVPYIDANFKTLANRDSRGIAGEFMGGYGAIRFGMKHTRTFLVRFMPCTPSERGPACKSCTRARTGTFWPMRNPWMM